MWWAFFTVFWLIDSMIMKIIIGCWCRCALRIYWFFISCDALPFLTKQSHHSCCSGVFSHITWSSSAEFAGIAHFQFSFFFGGLSGLLVHTGLKAEIEGSLLKQKMAKQFHRVHLVNLITVLELLTFIFFFLFFPLKNLAMHAGIFMYNSLLDFLYDHKKNHSYSTVIKRHAFLFITEASLQ